jgi:cyclophilin family peptidyl-prolyl cis-trans isomerase
MATGVKWFGRSVAGLWLASVLTGCGGQAPEAKPGEQAKAPPQPGSAAPAPKLLIAPPGSPTPGAKSVGDARLHVPFKDAVVAEPPEGQSLPEKTKAGKSAGKLYEAITRPGGLWEQVRFVSPQGKKVAYMAVLQTDHGTIKIDLWPEVAPNHVRSFVALARAGYYDGLEFDRTIREEFEDAKGSYFECLEAGCPLGTGDPGYGSIGYWLRPELSDKLQHDEGIVGAWHAEEVETGACKFYITLSKAPWMDGNWTVFGKVSQGLDVARTILMRPVRNDEFKDRPVQPVVIRSITIETREVN